MVLQVKYMAPDKRRRAGTSSYSNQVPTISCFFKSWNNSGLLANTGLASALRTGKKEHVRFGSIGRPRFRCVDYLAKMRNSKGHRNVVAGEGMEMLDAQFGKAGAW